MKFFKYILPAILAFAGVSCVTPFDMDLDDDPVIYLESFPGSDEFVVFDIKPAYSKSNTPKKPEFKPEVILTVNGELIPVTLNTGSCVTGKYPETRYIAQYTPVPGDKMRVDVSSEGFKSIYAETTVPAAFPDRKIDYRTETFGDRDLNMIYVTPDNSSAKLYAYAMQIYEESEYDYTDSVKVYNYWYAGDRVSDYYDMAPGGLEGMEVTFNKNEISIWQSGIQDGEKDVMQVALPSYWAQGEGSYDLFFPHESEENVYDEWGEEIIGTVIRRSRHKLILYSLSGEFYKYMIAKELTDTNAEFFAGLVPSNFCYTNVKGGYGAFAAVSWVETDWITKEFIENNR